MHMQSSVDARTHTRHFVLTEEFSYMYMHTHIIMYFHHDIVPTQFILIRQV